MALMIQRLCVFCGSSSGTDPVYRQAAQTLGAVLVARGIELVYGGGHVGLMGEVANAVLHAGGRVTGVTPQALVDREIAHTGLTELRVVSSMHERKALMAELSDAFVALPGGFGTLEEFCEVLTWSQLGIHRKACGLLNVQGYFNALLALLEHGVQEGFIKQAHRGMVLADTDPNRLLAQLDSYQVPVIRKWIDAKES